MTIEVGSYEAKTKLPELLRGVQRGNRYMITLRGEVVAELIPSSAQRKDVAAAVEQMRRFVKSNPPIPGIDTKALIEDGRD
jgi:antitoxin (DNA-binding transcriptional repressor) of toxin-antitoxin stability system